MKLGLVTTPHLVDLKRLGLDAVREEPGHVSIGACATHALLSRSPLVRKGCEVLASAEGDVGNVRVRSVGTIGGNLCFAEPGSDIGTVLLLADARLELRSEAGVRSIETRDFFVGAFTTALRPEELLVRIVVPTAPTAAVTSYRRIAVGERPTAGFACRLEPGTDGRIGAARVVVGAAHPHPFRLHDGEAALEGIRSSGEEAKEAVDHVAALAAAACEPIGDVHATPHYKRRLVSVLARRALTDALARLGVDD